MSNRTFTLDNDFVVLYTDGLDGGGINHLPDFRSVVGKKKYNKAVEWCAGFGVIGFDFLNRGICNNMAFIDCYKPAIEWLQKTIEHNNVQPNTALYEVNRIGMLPEDVKFDLVLANPPHSFDEAAVEHFNNTVEDMIVREDIIRITCDLNLEIHKEFFANIRKHLEPNADIFMSEVGYFDVIQKLAEDAGLVFVATHPAPCLSHDSNADAVIFHFKEPV